MRISVPFIVGISKWRKCNHSKGKEEAVKIKAKTDKEKTIILATAYKEEQKIRSKGEAQAIKIYARTFKKDTEFYTFIHTLEAYQKCLAENTTIVLSSDSEFFHHLIKTGK